MSRAASCGAPEARAECIRELGPWFHNLHLPDGLQTAPDHRLGDFPGWKWREIAHAFPDRMDGWSVLDVGCNAGFYSIEMARRGATVTAIDSNPLYLRQARWVAGEFGVAERIEFRNQQLYELGRESACYDLVLFLGVLYHLRYPLLGLDLIARKTRRLLCLQTMTMPGEANGQPPEDVGLADRHLMLLPIWPRMAFIEKSFADDPSNWWAPNRACVEAMLRSTGMKVVACPADEFYLCVPDPDCVSAWADASQEEYAAALGLMPDFFRR
ncbi:MAG: TIGR04290 family methyltransferase [Thiogranum sp.]|nr:TIGR04290 family methyltransferase [Thiogranum sp.]